MGRMTSAGTIEPVPPSRWTDAIRFVVGGERRDPIQDVRAEALRQLVFQRGEKSASIWWARRKRRCVAAAVIVKAPGKTGMLFHTPATGDGVDRESLAKLVRCICRSAIEEGLSMVQTILNPDARGDVEVLERGGMIKLGSFVHLKLDLAKNRPFERDSSLQWRDYDHFTEEELIDVISQTYAGSLDCPGLVGVREIPDVLEGHKAAGVFCPEAWWIVERGGTTAGCILVNDSAVSPSAETVYMGTVPRHRRCGVARALLSRAADQARERGREAIALAVDADNRYATSLYTSQGYREIDRKLAYIVRHFDVVTRGNLEAL